MRFHRFLACLAVILSAVILFAETPYRVSVSSRLNVRKAPSTSAVVLGTLRNNQLIEVISIEKGWAKVKFNNGIGYVNARYLEKARVPAPAPAPSPIKKEKVEETAVVPAPKENKAPEPRPSYDGSFTPLFSFGKGMPENLSLYLALQAGIGYSNFNWSGGNSNGSLSYSIDLQAQLYFNRKTSFIPKNWYSEISLGYDKKGAANFGMNYIHARIYPIGYCIPLNPIRIVASCGVALGFPLNDLSTSLKSWSADFQFGICPAIRIEWKQYALGYHFEYDFTQVASSCNQTLNNIAFMATVSYKFAQIGH